MLNKEKDRIQRESFDALKKNNFNGIFLLPTGTGKSRVLIACVLELIKLHDYKNIWYLCNSTDLRDKDFVKELKQWGASHLESKITRMCYQTAYKLKDCDVDIVIADEFDYSLSAEYSKVYKNNKFKHRIFTTAYIDSKKNKFLKQIGVPIVYNKSLQEVENQSVLNKSQYYFVNFLMSDDESDMYVRFNERIEKLINTKQFFASQGDVDKVDYYNYRIDVAVRARKRFLNALGSSASHCRKLMREIYDEDKDCKILAFCELNKQADAISKYTYHSGSDQSNLEKFRNDEIQCLAVCGKINRGVNIKNVRYVIFESCNSSKTQLVQRLGRGKRLKTDEILKVFFMIPCYKQNGIIKYTKIRDWIVNAAAKLDLSKSEVYRFKKAEKKNV